MEGWNSFICAFNKSTLSDVGRYDRQVVPVNRVCVFETRDGSYAKFMFTKSDYNPNGCTHTLTCVVLSVNVDGSGSTATNGTPSYNWTGVSITSDNTDDVDVDQPGTYNLTVTDPFSGCTADTTVTVIQDIVDTAWDKNMKKDLEDYCDKLYDGEELNEE